MKSILVWDPAGQAYLTNDSQANHGRRRSGLLGTSSHSQTIATVVDVRLDLMIDDIEAMEQTSPTEWEQMKQLKKDIIHRCIIIGSWHGRQVSQQCSARTERSTSSSVGVDESTAEWQLKMIQAIETRRLHMLERSTCIIQLKLATKFKNN